MQARMYRSDVNFRKTLGPVLLRIRGPAFLNLWCVLAERFVLNICTVCQYRACAVLVFRVDIYSPFVWLVAGADLF
jgi:hypothetical protein